MKGTPRGFTRRKISHPLAPKSPKRCCLTLPQHCAWLYYDFVAVSVCCGMQVPRHAWHALLQVVQECLRHSQEHHVHAAPCSQVGRRGEVHMRTHLPARVVPRAMTPSPPWLCRWTTTSRPTVRVHDTLRSPGARYPWVAQQGSHGCGSCAFAHPQGDNQETSPQYVRWLMEQRHFNGRRKRVTKRSGDWLEMNAWRG